MDEGKPTPFQIGETVYWITDHEWIGTNHIGNGLTREIAPVLQKGIITEAPEESSDLYSLKRKEGCVVYLSYARAEHIARTPRTAVARYLEEKLRQYEKEARYLLEQIKRLERKHKP